MTSARSSTAARGRRRPLGEAAVVLAFLALAGLVFEQTSTSFVEQGAATGGAMFNAAMFPDLLAWCLVLLGALQLGGIIRTMAAARDGAPAGPRESMEAAPPVGERSGLLEALISAALFVLYLLLLKPLGYHLMTPLFMAACFYVLGTRSILRALGLAIATSLAMSFVFEYWMNIILPVGRFGIGF